MTKWLVLLLATTLAGADVSPSVRLAALEKTREQGPFEVKTVSFLVECDGSVDPRVMCWVSMPTKAGKPAPRSLTAVAVFHTPGAKDISSQLERIATESGFTAFGCIFPSSGTYGYSDKQRFYGFAASGSFATTAKAFERLRTAQHLNPRFCVFGYSAGGIMAQRFAEEYPNLVLGASSMCGHSYIQKNGATCPFLIMHTLGDFGMVPGDNLARYYTSQGVPVVRAILDLGWENRKKDNQMATHTFTDPANVLTMRYFEALDDLRTRAGGDTAPPVTAWPVVCAQGDVRRVAPNSASAVAAITKSGDTPMYLPSWRTHQVLLDLPPAPTRSVVNERSWVISRPAPDVQPEGVWIALQPLSDDLVQALADQAIDSVNDGLLQGDLRYAAIHRCIGIGTHGKRGDYKTVYKDAMTACPAAANLPVHLQAIDPTPEGFLSLGQIPRLTSLTIVFTRPISLDVWRKPLAAIAASRTAYRIGLLADAAVPAGMSAETVAIEPAGTRTWFDSMGLHQTAVEWAMELVPSHP